MENNKSVPKRIRVVFNAASSSKATFGTSWPSGTLKRQMAKIVGFLCFYCLWWTEREAGSAEWRGRFYSSCSNCLERSDQQRNGEDGGSWELRSKGEEENKGWPVGFDTDLKNAACDQCRGCGRSRRRWWCNRGCMEWSMTNAWEGARQKSEKETDFFFFFYVKKNG